MTTVAPPDAPLPDTLIPEEIPGGFTPQFHWRCLGTPSPVFPGFEIDICDRVEAGGEPDAVWHRNRVKGILKSHPEVKNLFGRTPITALWCFITASAQLGIAVAVSGQAWWVVFLVAYLIGAILNVAIFNLAHECNHSLVFRSKAANRWLYTFTSLPMFFAGHHTWWIEHHVHHNHLGSNKDFVKRRRSILLALKDRIFGYLPGPRVRRMTTWITTPLFWPIGGFMLITQFIRALFGLVVYAVTAIATRKLQPTDFALEVLADQHLVSGYHRYKIETWAVIYPALSLTLVGVMYWFFGPMAVLYLFLSAFFTTGFLHPLVFGLMLSNSHFHGHDVYQPSASNYGPVNWITFNFGLHAEHHDFHYIPWFRLPQLRKMAPEFYDDLKQTKSFTALALKFAFGTRDAFNNEERRNIEMLQVKSEKSSEDSPTAVAT